MDFTSIFNHREIKDELLHRSRKCKHFTKAFLRMYTQALKEIEANDAAGIDTHYSDNGIWTRHEWDAIRQTAFYRAESGSYCEFLSIANRIITQARQATA